MGLAIKKSDFTRQDYIDFKHRLTENLQTLEQLLLDPNFGQGEVTIGAEVEFSLVNNRLDPHLINKDVIKECNSEQLQVELNRYNLECNLSPVKAQGIGFDSLSKEMAQMLAKIDTQCQQHNGKIALIGILPTLHEEHFDISVMTDEPRYHVLSNGIKSMRGEPFYIDIHGQDVLQKYTDELTLEGANTSFQVQIKIPPNQFADMFNAVQLVTPFVTALAANSPTLLGKCLWDETRIALFKQSIDTRKAAPKKWRKPNRVTFGYGWLREGAYEVFAESVALFEPLIPQIQTQSNQHNGNGPDLFELRLHQGSIWPWNRVIYDPANGGHLRIEMRSLPTGPTITDMMANAAFFIGSAYYLKDHIRDILPSFPFMFAEYNFYSAAKKGLNSKLLSPFHEEGLNKEYPVTQILSKMVDFAKAGLHMLNVDEHCSETLIGTIEDRIQAKQNGAIWQKQMIQNYERQGTRDEAILQMFYDYQYLSQQGKPVSGWSTK